MKLWEKYSEEEIFQFFKESSSPQEFMQKMGYKRGKDAYKDIRKRYPWITYRYAHLEGKQFGELTVIEKMDIKEKIDNHVRWLCECSCGNRVIIISSDLLRGIRLQCSECSLKNRQIDLVGQTFGKITIIAKDIERSKREKRSYFFGKCSCGNPEIKSYNGNYLKNGMVCSCGCYSKSKGEEKVKKILQKLQIIYQTQFRFQECKDSSTLPFDFYLPEYNTLIEYQGVQHYKMQNYFGEQSFQQTQKHDNIKRNYCKEHNYKLIEIPYWDYNKLNEEYIQFLLEEKK